MRAHIALGLQALKLPDVESALWDETALERLHDD